MTMASYFLKPMSKSSYKITLNRQQVGGVVKREEGWIATINGRKTDPFPTASAAFQEAVKVANRISLCGENDPLKAYEVIKERNESLRREVEEANEKCGFQAWKIRKRRTAI
jgi:hypothetical protein